MYADYAVRFGGIDADNYHYLLANGEAKYSQLFVVQDGVRTALATADSPLIPDQGWHDLELICEGGEITARLDGTEVLQAVADTDCEGPFGVGSLADAVYFDDIAIGEPAIGEPAGPDAGSEPDAGTGTDARTGVPSGTNAGPSSDTSDGGCSCRVGEGDTGARAPLGVLFALWALLLRRRR